jgi:hypothetical protein
MSKKVVDPAYLKLPVSVSLERWIVQYFKDNNINLSNLVSKLLKSYINEKIGKK